jgi:hydroxymethylpyrimidine pyrophosphatase-like HAD family hydrolase
MLVLDLDDTLLTDDHTISVETAMLFKAQELGVYVILASGRPSNDCLRQRITIR